MGVDLDVGVVVVLLDSDVEVSCVEGSMVVVAVDMGAIVVVFKVVVVIGVVVGYSVMKMKFLFS